MEDGDDSDTTCSADVPMGEPELDQPDDQMMSSEYEEGEGEYIGVDPQDTNLCTETVIKEEQVEIKEEEIELDPVLLPDEEEAEDPFGCNEEDVAAGSSSSTDTADEALEEEPERKRRKEVEPVAQILIRKPYSRKVKMASQFVPGMMVQKNERMLCLQCGREFETAVSFAMHLDQYHVHLPELPQSCLYCPRKFETRQDLQRHMLHHTWLEPLRCSVCHLTLQSSKGLVAHLVSHWNVGTAKCNLCLIKFASQNMLERHNLEVHSEPPMITKAIKLAHLVCYACGQQEAMLKDLRTHKYSHKGAVKCVFCRSHQNNMTRLESHISKFHPLLGTISYHCCPNCNELYHSQEQMIEHKATCNLPRSFESRFRLECQICHLSYFELEHFETHMRLHSILGKETDRRACSLCSFYAKNTTDYAVHMANVHGFRDSVQSLENDFKNTFGRSRNPQVQQVRCIVPNCQQTPQPGMMFHKFPIAQPERWKWFLSVFKLPAEFKPDLGHRVCSQHFSMVGFNAADMVKKLP